MTSNRYVKFFGQINQTSFNAEVFLQIFLSGTASFQRNSKWARKSFFVAITIFVFSICTGTVLLIRKTSFCINLVRFLSINLSICQSSYMDKPSIFMGRVWWLRKISTFTGWTCWKWCNMLSHSRNILQSLRTSRSFRWLSFNPLHNRLSILNSIIQSVLVKTNKYIKKERPAKIQHLIRIAFSSGGNKNRSEMSDFKKDFFPDVLSFTIFVNEFSLPVHWMNLD